MDSQDSQTATDQPIEDATIIESSNETTEPTAMAPADDQAKNFLTLDNLIKGYIRDLQKLKEDLKQQQQMFKDAVENDLNFKTHNDKAKEVTKAKNGAKLQLLKQPALVELKAKVDDLRDEIKATQEGLTEYLVEYLKVAKTNQIITDNGDVHEIINTPKLIKKSAKYNP